MQSARFVYASGYEWNRNLDEYLDCDSKLVQDYSKSVNKSQKSWIFSSFLIFLSFSKLSVVKHYPLLSFSKIQSLYFEIIIFHSKMYIQHHVNVSKIVTFKSASGTFPELFSQMLIAIARSLNFYREKARRAMLPAVATIQPATTNGND